MDLIPPGTDLFQIPYQQPPPGLKSDFNGPSDLLTIFRTLVPIMIFVTTLFMVFRVRARSGRDDRWRMDDWFAIMAWIATTGLGSLLVVSVQRLGRHTWDISIGSLNSAWNQRVFVCIAFLVSLSLLLGKLCLLALYYRFFGHIDKVRRQLYVATALCFPLLCACIIFPTLAGPPPGKPWGTSNPHNTANSIVAMMIGIENILTDLLIFYIPIPIIMKMNLSPKKKGGVLAIFLTGLIAIIADAIVMFYRVRLWQQIDALRDGMIVPLCSFIEACISIVCSSMPCAAKVWKVHILGSGFYQSLRSRFASIQETGSNSSMKADSNMHRAEQPQKKRRGLYSIGTLPTTNYSMTQLSKSDGFVELQSFEDKNSALEHSENSDREHIPSGERLELKACTQSSVAFHDPSNFLSRGCNGR